MSLDTFLKTPPKGLKTIYLYDSYLKNKFISLDLDGGHTNLTGDNGAGKTSILNLIPVFFGASPLNLMDRSANKKNFVDYYLPTERSMVVYEYRGHKGVKCVVLYRNQSQGTHNFRFVDGSAVETLFTDENIGLLQEFNTVKVVFDNLYKGGVEVSRQIQSFGDFVAILTNDKKKIQKDLKLRDLCTTFAIVEGKHELKHIGALTQITTNSKNLLNNFKSMLLDAFLDNEKIIAKPLVSTEFNALLSDIETIRHLETETEKLYRGVHLKNTVMNTFAELKAYQSLLRTMLEENEQKIKEYELEKSSLNQNSRSEMQVINSQITDLRSKLAGLQGDYDGCTHALKSIEDVQVKFDHMNISAMQEEFKNLSTFRQAIVEAEEFKDKLIENQSSITTKFEKLKNDALEALHEANEVLAQQERKVNSDLQIASSGKEKRLDKIANERTSELHAFEQKIRFERQNFTNELNAANDEIATSRELTDEERDQNNEYKLALEVKKQNLSDKENQLSQTHSKVSQLKDSRRSAIEELNQILRRLEVAVKTEEELRVALFQKNTLLRFLNEETDNDWRNTIAKVINPELFSKTNLSPVWEPSSGDTKPSLYGLQIDLSKLDIAEQADSQDVLQQRLTEAESKTALLKEQRKKAERTVEQTNRAVNEIEVKAIDLENEKTKLKVECENTERIYNQYGQKVRDDVKKRKDAAIAKRNEIDLRYSAFNEREVKERQMIEESFNQKRQHLVSEYEKYCAELQAQLNQIAQQLQRNKDKYTADVDSLNKLYYSELHNQGLDVRVIEDAESRITQAKQQYRKVKAYESILTEYKSWFTTELSRKSKLIEESQRLKNEIYHLNQQIKQLDQQLEQLKRNYHDRFNKLGELVAELTDKNKCVGGFVTRIEDVSESMNGIKQLPLPHIVSFEVLMREVDTALSNQKKQIEQLRAATHAATTVLRSNDSFSLYKQWRSRMDMLGDLGGTNYFVNAMQEIENMLNNEIPVKTQTTVANFEVSVYELRNYIEALFVFKRKLKRVSTDLTEHINKTNPFAALSEITIELQSLLHDKHIVEQLNSFIDELQEYGINEKSISKLPSSEFIKCCSHTIKALESTKGQTDNVHSMVSLYIGYSENNRTVDVRSDADLTHGSSTGLSRLIVIIIFMSLMRKLCSDDSVHIHMPLDEIGQFDAENTARLFEMMHQYNINLVCAQPTLGFEVSKRFAHKHDICRKRGVRQFVDKKTVTRENPLL